MKIIASAAVTSDGYMDDCSDQRLVISGDEDWKEVYRLRAGCDAILVGAATVRRDNPSLVIRDPALRRQRVALGMTQDIIKVTFTASGMLDTSSRFFTEGTGARKIVLLGPEVSMSREKQLEGAAETVRLASISARSIIDALSAKGVSTLLIEGGARTLKMFMDEGAIDEMRLAVSPHTLEEIGKPCPRGHEEAPRLPYFGNLPFESRASKEFHRAGDIEVTHYVMGTHIGSEDRKFLQRAIDLSRKCTPTDTAYCVGCVIVTTAGELFEGYTHETAPANHAEEEAILKAQRAGADLAGAVIYTSMEPCSTRASKPVSCSELIINNRMARVVYAYAEPEHFVRCDATRILRQAGIEVVTGSDLAGQVMEINSHIIG